MSTHRRFDLARMIVVVAAIWLAVGAFGAEVRLSDLIPPANAIWNPVFGDISSVQVQSIKADNMNAMLRMSLTGLHLAPIFRDKMAFTRLSLPDAGVTNEIGLPEIPVVRQLVAVPEGAIVTLTVTPGPSKMVEDLNVYPVQEPVPEALIANAGLMVMPFKQNKSFYNLRSPYPAQLAHVSEPMKIRDVTVVMLEMSPMQYRPGSKQLTVYENLDVKLTYTMPKTGNTRVPPGLIRRDDTKINTDVIKIDRDVKFTDKNIMAARSFILNADMYRIPKNFKIMYDYLIITPDAYVPNLKPLVDWKRERGLSVRVAKLSETGTTVNSIKAYIQDMYTNSGIRYVLLVGDTNSIPAYMYAGTAASDYFYSLVSGFDPLADIAVGRFSARSATEVANMVKKSVDYEQTPYVGNTAWYKKATLISDAGYFQDTSNWVASFLTARGYTVTKLYQSLGNANVANVTAAINGGSAFVNYRGHGWEDGWGTSGFSNTNVNALTNGRMLPVIISPTCLTGCYDAPSDCYSETWLKTFGAGTPRGAVAYWGSSRISYGGYNDELCKGAYKALFNDNIPCIGDIANKAKIYMICTYSYDDAAKHELHFFNLFGDPELHVWTAAP